MTNYFKYKKKYLKFNQLHGGDLFYKDYVPKKVDIDMNLLKNFFKGTNFSEQDNIREKFSYFNDKEKLFDNLFSLHKNLFCVFFNILNKCTNSNDQLKCYLAIKELKLNLVGNNYKKYLEEYQPKQSTYNKKIIETDFKFDFLLEPDAYGERQTMRIFLYFEVFDEFIDNLKNKTIMEFENLLDQIHTLSPELFILLKKIITNDNPSKTDVDFFRKSFLEADKENDIKIKQEKEDFKLKYIDFIKNHTANKMDLDGYKFLDYLTTLDDYVKMNETNIDKQLNQINSYSSKLYELFKQKLLGTFSNVNRKEYDDIILKTKVERLKQFKPGPSLINCNNNCIFRKLVKSSNSGHHDSYYNRDQSYIEETFEIKPIISLRYMNEIDFQNLLILLDQLFTYMPELYKLYKNYLLEPTDQSFKEYKEFVRQEFKISNLL